MFLSTFINKLDKKGRVSVPASFRTALAHQSFQGIVISRSFKYSVLDGCGLDRMQRLSEGIDRLGLFSDAQDDLAAALFADAHMLVFDGDGRISVPPQLLEFATITDSVAFVGRGATFQLWQPETFERYQKEARLRLKEQDITLTLPVEKGT